MALILSDGSFSDGAKEGRTFFQKVGQYIGINPNDVIEVALTSELDGYKADKTIAEGVSALLEQRLPSD